MVLHEYEALSTAAKHDAGASARGTLLGDVYLTRRGGSYAAGHIQVSQTTNVLGHW